MKTEKSKEIVEQALKQLYGDGMRDLTSEGYQEALSKLRAVDLASARRVERALATFLKDRIFPLRKRDWVKTSQGLRARLALLPENPYVRQDVKIVRDMLGIPDNQIKPVPGDPLWKDVSRHTNPENVKRVTEEIMAARWHAVHIQEANSEKISQEEETAGIISEPMFRSAVASAHVDLTHTRITAWLREAPSGPPPYDSSAVPLDWAVARMVERHRLPWSAVSPLTFYTLTENSEHVAKIAFLSVTTSYPYYRPHETDALTLSVEGIDEYITQDDWDNVWVRYIKPMQELQWNKRGMMPKGRRTVDILRLGKLLPLYVRKIKDKTGIKQLLENPGDEFDKRVFDMDQETIRRTIRELERLLRPKA